MKGTCYRSHFFLLFCIEREINFNYILQTVFATTMLVFFSTVADKSKATLLMNLEAMDLKSNSTR